ncbi:MAG: hypothetical protein COA88_11815 [Kordia sp.]|nr:MAG: hypothetical protein COA88_11815 [Kordia sp.]
MNENNTLIDSTVQSNGTEKYKKTFKNCDNGNRREFTNNRVMNLRQIHIQSVAEVWSETEEIENFIKNAKCDPAFTGEKEGQDYKYINPVKWLNDQGKDSNNSYWTKMVVKLGPKDPTKKVIHSLDDDLDNPYYFWYEGVSPFFNISNGNYMLQPYLNNRIVIKVPSRPRFRSNASINSSIAIAAYFAASPSLFGKRNETQENKIYSGSGGSTVGHLDLMEETFGINSNLFIKLEERYTSKFTFNKFKQSLSNVLTPLGPEKNKQPSFDLADSPALYNSFAAALQSLVALMWSSDEIYEAIITKPEDLKKEFNGGSTIQLMNELLGYEYPFSLDLIIMEDKDVAFHLDPVVDVVGLDKPEKNCWLWKYDEKVCEELEANSSEADGCAIKLDKYYLHPQIPLQTLQLVIPMKPRDNSIAPVALTRYNVDSSGYPFSC